MTPITSPKRSVLIVDDSPEDQLTFERLLRDDPEVEYQCATAESVADGLELCRARHFDAILLDYGLPDDDGLEFLTQLVAEHGPHSFPVVMITGLGDVEVAATAMKLGAQDYLTKGLRLDRYLSLAISNAIEKVGLQREVVQQRHDLERSNEQLQQMVAALTEERATLARRVEERTADLRATNAALERALRLKDEFLANMSHELRTPLNGVLGRAEAMREEIYGPLNERQQAALISIEESGRHLLALITDILDLAKIEAGRLDLEIEMVAVDQVVRQSLRLVSQPALAKQIGLSLTIDSMVETIQADPRRLIQILVNLLSNAVKFTPNGGRAGLEVQGDPGRQTVRFTVWDTGIGIAPENLPRLFQPFVQVDSSLTRRHEGTGLGLALVRRLTEAHGGTVAVESTPDHGSRFSVIIAWAPAAPAPPPPAPRAEADMPLILVADDNEMSLRVLAEYLPSHGYRIATAQNGVEAIARAAEARPRLILMDIQMPVMSGLEAIQHIRADKSLDGTPIIALTALAMPGDRERCLQAGADEYLVKPVKLADLLATIDARVRRT